MPDNNGEITPGELARRVGEVLSRLQGLVDLVENRYVRKDILELYKETINQSLLQVQQALGTKADASGLSGIDKKADKTVVDNLEKRVASLEDNNKWLVRLVGALIVGAIFAAVFTAGGGLAK